jgi:hypothetical protein
VNQPGIMILEGDIPPLSAVSGQERLDGARWIFRPAFAWVNNTEVTTTELSPQHRQACGQCAR